jgi:hypothetical protein
MLKEKAPSAKIILQIDHFFNTYAWPFNQTIAMLYSEFCDMSSPFMDLYLLARLFRTYKTPGLMRRGAGDMAQRIIIIAGNAHTKRYQDFFKKFGFNEVFDTEKEDLYLKRGCLDLRREDLIPFTPVTQIAPTAPVEKSWFRRIWG